MSTESGNTVGLLGRTLVWSSVANYLTFGSNVLVRLFLARRILDADFGVYAVATAACDVFQVLSAAKLNLGLIQHPGPGTERKTLRLVWLQAGLSLLIGAAIAAMTARQTGWQMGALVGGYVLSQVLGYFRAYHQTLLERDFVYRPIATATLISVVTTGVLIVVAAAAAPGAWVLVTKDLLTAALLAALIWRAARSHRGHRPSDAGAVPVTYRQLVRTGTLFFAQTHALSIFERTDLLLLGMTATAATAVGQYSQAKWLAITGVSVLSMTLTPLYPVYARLTRDSGSLAAASFSTINFAVTRVAAAGAMLAIGGSGVIVRIVLGPSWPGAAAALQTLGPVIVGNTAFMHANAWTVATGNLRSATILAWTRAVLAFAVSAIVVSESGAGLAFTQAAGGLLATLVMAHWDRRITRAVVSDVIGACTYMGAAFCLGAQARMEFPGAAVVMSLLAATQLAFDARRVVRLLRRRSPLFAASSAEPQ